MRENKSNDGMNLSMKKADTLSLKKLAFEASRLQKHNDDAARENYVTPGVIYSYTRGQFRASALAYLRRL